MAHGPLVLIFPRKKQFWHFMQIVFIEISNPVLSSAELAKRVVKVKIIVQCKYIHLADFGRVT